MRRQILDPMKFLRGDDVSGALFGCLLGGSHGPHPKPSAATSSARDLEQNGPGASGPNNGSADAEKPSCARGRCVAGDAAVALARLQRAPCAAGPRHPKPSSWRGLPRGRLHWGSHCPPVCFCATGEPATYPCGRSCRRRRRGVPCRSSATVSRAPSPIERTRKTKCFAPPSLKRRGRIKTSRNQLATQVEHGSISVRDDALGFAAVRADELGANRRLRELLLAIIFRKTRRPSWSTTEAPSAASAPGLFIVVMAYFLVL